MVSQLRSKVLTREYLQPRLRYQRNNLSRTFERCQLVRVTAHHHYGATQIGQVAPCIGPTDDGAVLVDQLLCACLQHEIQVALHQSRVSDTAVMECQRHIGAQHLGRTALCKQHNGAFPQHTDFFGFRPCRCAQQCQSPDTMRRLARYLHRHDASHRGAAQDQFSRMFLKQGVRHRFD